MLKVNNIDVYYGAIHAIKDVSLEVPDGEIVTLIGSNGAGKSTTLHTISGLIKPKNGSIIFEDKNIVGVPAHKIVGMGLCQVPEGRHVFANMTVMENLELGAYLRSDKAGIAEDLDKIFKMDEPSMGLAPLLVKEIFNIIKEINESGTTVLLVEQNANMALSIADKAYVLETGRIALAGTAQELASSEAVRKAYLGG